MYAQNQNKKKKKENDIKISFKIILSYQHLQLILRHFQVVHDYMRMYDKPTAVLTLP